LRDGLLSDSRRRLRADGEVLVLVLVFFLGEEMRHGRQDDDGADHVHGEAEHQQDAHVPLELQIGEDPHGHAAGQADAGEQRGFAVERIFW